ncbi:hypothetical protein DFH06DRAFT_1139781 [Mycena polygramma]|nr:hypothetical protein DFH06DRAFT_1139781 [Mycena polygramma]
MPTYQPDFDSGFTHTKLHFNAKLALAVSSTTRNFLPPLRAHKAGSDWPDSTVVRLKPGDASSAFLSWFAAFSSDRIYLTVDFRSQPMEHGVHLPTIDSPRSHAEMQEIPVRPGIGSRASSHFVPAFYQLTNHPDFDTSLRSKTQQLPGKAPPSCFHGQIESGQSPDGLGTTSNPQVSCATICEKLVKAKLKTRHRPSRARTTGLDAEIFDVITETQSYVYWTVYESLCTLTWLKELTEFELGPYPHNSDWVLDVDGYVSGGRILSGYSRILFAVPSVSVLDALLEPGAWIKMDPADPVWTIHHQVICLIPNLAWSSLHVQNTPSLQVGGGHNPATRPHGSPFNLPGSVSDDPLPLLPLPVFNFNHKEMPKALSTLNPPPLPYDPVRAAVDWQRLQADLSLFGLVCERTREDLYTEGLELRREIETLLSETSDAEFADVRETVNNASAERRIAPCKAPTTPASSSATPLPSAIDIGADCRRKPKTATVALERRRQPSISLAPFFTAESPHVFDAGSGDASADSTGIRAVILELLAPQHARLLVSRSFIEASSISTRKILRAAEAPLWGYLLLPASRARSRPGMGDVPKVTDPKRAHNLPLLFIYLDPTSIPTPVQRDGILCDVIPPPTYEDLWPRLYRKGCTIDPRYKNICNAELIQVRHYLMLQELIQLVTRRGVRRDG